MKKAKREVKKGAEGGMEELTLCVSHVQGAAGPRANVKHKENIKRQLRRETIKERLSSLILYCHIRSKLLVESHIRNSVIYLNDSGSSVYILYLLISDVYQIFTVLHSINSI